MREGIGANPRVQGELRKQEKLDLRAFNDGVAAMLIAPSARLAFWQFANGLDALADPFSTDALLMARNCARLAAGRELLQLAQEAAPDLYELMVTESIQANRAARQTKAALETQDQDDQTKGEAHGD